MAPYEVYWLSESPLLPLPLPMTLPLGHAYDNENYYLSRPEFLARAKSMDDAKDMHDWKEKVVYMDNFHDL